MIIDVCLIEILYDNENNGYKCSILETKRPVIPVLNIILFFPEASVTFEEQVSLSHIEVLDVQCSTSRMSVQ